MKLFNLFKKKYYYYDPEYQDLWWSYIGPFRNLFFIMDPDVECITKKQAKEQQKILGLPRIPKKDIPEHMIR